MLRPLKTAVDAFERDLTPWVVADACASHSGHETHNAGLLATRTFIGAGQVITTSDIASPMLRSTLNADPYNRPSPGGSRVS